MAVYQEKDKGTWRVVFRYTDFTGERKQTQKRGFKTKREATAWEHEMMLRKGNKLDMTFESFYEIYSEYKRQRVKESTNPIMPLRCFIGPESGKGSCLPSHRQILILKNRRCGSIKRITG